MTYEIKIHYEYKTNIIKLFSEKNIVMQFAFKSVAHIVGTITAAGIINIVLSCHSWHPYNNNNNNIMFTVIYNIYIIVVVFFS